MNKNKWFLTFDEQENVYRIHTSGGGTNPSSETAEALISINGGNFIYNEEDESCMIVSRNYSLDHILFLLSKLPTEIFQKMSDEDAQTYLDSIDEWTIEGQKLVSTDKANL